MSQIRDSDQMQIKIRQKHAKHDLAQDLHLQNSVSQPKSSEALDLAFPCNIASPKHSIF